MLEQEGVFGKAIKGNYQGNGEAFGHYFSHNVSNEKQIGGALCIRRQKETNLYMKCYKSFPMEDTYHNNNWETIQLIKSMIYKLCQSGQKQMRMDMISWMLT